MPGGGGKVKRKPVIHVGYKLGLPGKHSSQDQSQPGRLERLPQYEAAYDVVSP